MRDLHDTQDMATGRFYFLQWFMTCINGKSVEFSCVYCFLFSCVRK